MQPERSSYDNIIVRTAKGQSSAWLVLRGPRLREPTDGLGIAAGASGKPEEMPALWSSLALHSGLRGAQHLLSGPWLRPSACWLLPPLPPLSKRQAAVMLLAAAEKLHAALGGAYHSNWGGLADDHLLAMWLHCLKGQRRSTSPAAFPKPPVWQLWVFFSACVLATAPLAPQMGIKRHKRSLIAQKYSLHV